MPDALPGHPGVRFRDQRVTGVAAGQLAASAARGRGKQGHVDGGQARLRLLDLGEGTLTESAGGGRARTHEQGQRIAPGRVLPLQLPHLAVDVLEVSEGVRGGGRGRGQGDPPPRA